MLSYFIRSYPLSTTQKIPYVLFCKSSPTAHRKCTVTFRVLYGIDLNWFFFASFLTSANTFSATSSAETCVESTTRSKCFRS